MKKNLYLLSLHFLITFILIEQINSIKKHRCIHDQLVQKHGRKLTKIDDMQNGRNLQTVNGFGPLRIHYVYNTTDIVQSDTIGSNIFKIMDIIKSFWQKIIQVDYLPSLSFNIDADKDRNNYTCLSFLVPRTLLDNPTPNKDFGILVEAKDDGDVGVTAYSYPCAYSTLQNKPNWGIVHWNKYYMTSFDPLSFQQNLHIAIHQITHVLGFSQILYSFFKTGKLTNVGRDAYISGPYINNEVQRQYECPNPPGMLLQSNGGSGTALSHWSRKTANNQLMTAGVSPSNPTISYITLALLEQTGWYRKIYKTYGSFINYGYKKGCGMIDSSNCSSNQYCKVPNIKSCDYDRAGLGYCKNQSLSNCLYVKFYINFLCIDPNYQKSSLNKDIIAVTGQNGGKYSRCFQSDMRTIGSTPSKYSFRCYQVICSATRKTLTIKIGKTFGLCLFPGQTITIKGYEGTLKCPLSFQEVCGILRCPKECSANGICLHGKCLCAPSYSGQSCSDLSSVGFSSKTQLFLPQDNNGCLKGSYLTIFGDCQRCPFQNCASCNRDQCLLCINDRLPRKGLCY